MGNVGGQSSAFRLKRRPARGWRLAVFGDCLPLVPPASPLLPAVLLLAAVHLVVPRFVEKVVVAAFGVGVAGAHAVKAVSYRRERGARRAAHIEETRAPQPGAEAAVELTQDAAFSIFECQGARVEAAVPAGVGVVEVGGPACGAAASMRGCNLPRAATAKPGDDGRKE